MFIVPLISWLEKHQREVIHLRKERPKRKKKGMSAMACQACQRSSGAVSSLQTPSGEIWGELANTWKRFLSFCPPPCSARMRVTDKIHSFLSFFV